MGIFQQRFLPLGILVMFVVVGCGNNAGSGTTQPPTYPVTLQVDMTSYHPGDTIRVTLKNQSGQTIYYADHRTNCTVLLVERQVASSWEPVALCKLMIATRIHSLKAGDSSAVTLVSTQQWPSGTYQARLDYSNRADTGSSTLTTVYSTHFRLG